MAGPCGSRNKRIYFEAAGADAAGAAGADAAGSDAAGAAAAGVDASGADAAGAAAGAWADADSAGAPCDSPCMSTLSPPFMMTNNASSANAMKPTKIFHMICLQI